MTVERLSTGIAGLDALIEGGIPKGFTVLIAGNPGTGKTVLTTHFLYAGLTKNENGIYVSFTEADYSFYNNTDRFGMKFREFAKQNKFSFIDFSAVTQDGIQDALEEVLATIKETHAKRIVIDSFSAIFQAFVNPNDARIVLHVVLGKMLRAEGVTTMVIGEVPIGSATIGAGIEEFVADGIIKLEHGFTNASPIILKVIKMRTTLIDREPHICALKEHGMVVFPKKSIALNFNSSSTRVLTGIPGLDERMGGGLLEGTVTTVIGASGVGKTTFALEFLTYGVVNGERGLYCTFEETYGELKRSAGSAKYNLDDFKEKELFILSTLLEHQSPDELLDMLEKQIVDTRPKRIVIDSLSSFEHEYKHEIYQITKRIVSLIRKYHLTGLLTIQTTHPREINLTDMGISSLFHNIILLRYVEAKYTMKRTMVLLKMRATYHEHSILEFVISENGIQIIGTIDNNEGILSDTSQGGYDEFPKMEDEIRVESQKERKKRLAGFERSESEMLNRETTERKERKEETKKNLDIDNKSNVIDKSDAKHE
ncbi:MAG: ATPase domain-containing protein [Nitrososphaeraceae archaeon]